MITERIRAIARELENIGRHKIKLAELVLGKNLSSDKSDELYAAAIRDQFGLVFEGCRDISFHQLYIALQMEEMYSADNVYYTSQELGRTPTDNEIKQHYLDSGRPNRFNKLFKQFVVET